MEHFAASVNDKLCLGIEIGGTKLQIALGNEQARIIDRRRLAVDPAGGAEGICRQIAQAVAEFARDHEISSVGIGFGGPVDWRTGKAARSHHVEGWADFDLVQWMRPIAQAPVKVDNDANTAALAEAIKGAGRGRDPVFYVTLGSGVGGGLVAQNQIFHGFAPGEAEIGHVRLDKSGTIVEQRCSGWAVDKKIREAAARHRNSILARLTSNQPPGGEAKYLRAAIEQGDPTALNILEETADDLAFGLSHVVHIVHPEVIIIGGGLSLMGEMLCQAIQRRLRPFIMDAFAPGPEIRIAALGEDVVPVGALLLARQALSGGLGK